MRLIVFPPNESIQKHLKDLYGFTDDCELKLVVSYKDSITCNSNQNSDKKILGLPKSYLRFELKKRNELMYSYYKDLKENLKSSDLEDGLDTMRDTLVFQPKYF